MKKSVKKKPPSTQKPSEFLAAGYQFVQYSDGALLLRKDADLRLFRFLELREGGDPVNGKLIVNFAAKVP